MHRIYSLLFALFVISSTQAQGIICNAAGNVVIFTNYDGGTLNINVDQNIPNIKIGVVSYEAVAIIISGTYASNVTEVRYAGFNSGGSTSITGAGSAATSITFAPASPLVNTYGYSSIICGYTCSTTSYQGGCNTVDQIEAYFNSVFSTSPLFMHRVQYGSWSGTQNISLGGDCCALAIPLSAQVIATDESCEGLCDGIISVSAVGGQSPYSYTWSNGANSANIGGLCPSTYTVTVTDNNGTIVVETGTIAAAIALETNQSLTLCDGESLIVGTNSYSTTGIYSDTLTSISGCDSVVNTDLIVNPSYSFTQFLPFNDCEEINVLVGSNTYTESGIYLDTLISETGCDSVVETTIAVLPSILITQEPADDIVTVGSNANFNLVASATATLQWQENNGTGFVSLSNAGQYTGTTTQNLTISNTIITMNNYLYRCIASETNCADTSLAAVLTVRESVGIEDAPNISTWNIYPNPASDLLFIHSLRTEKADYVLVDQTGKLVLSGVLKSTSNQVDVSTLTDGIYFLKIEGESTSAHSVIISR